MISDERLEIAEQLRENALGWRKVIEKNRGITGEIDLSDVCGIMQDVMHFCGIDGKTDAPTILARLAELIDPTCEMDDAGDVPDSVKDNLNTFFCSECGAPVYNDMSPSYCPYCGARVVDGGDS